jgi:hypothetical protein
VRVQGKEYDIVYDKTGERYGRGVGLSVRVTDVTEGKEPSYV